MATEDSGRQTPFVVEWRDGFKIDIREVDDQHRHLFKLVKALDVKTVEHTIDELLEYVVTHFTTEQEMMESSGYPAFEQHVRLHEEFGSHVADFLGSGEAWTEERVQELRRFLNKWLIGHIMTHDLRFGKWYAAHAGQNARPVQATREQRGFFARLFGLR